MSHVTNVIITLECLTEDQEDEVLDHVNRWAEKDDTVSKGSAFTKIPGDCIGGTKAFEATVFMGAFNYLDLDALLAHLVNHVPWRKVHIDPGRDVSVFVKGEDDCTFSERFQGYER